MRGVMLPNVACSMKQITDGTSKTVAVGEIRADVTIGAHRGVWAGTLGCSGLYGFGCGTLSMATSGSNPSDDTGPNNAGGASNGGDWDQHLHDDQWIGRCGQQLVGFNPTRHGMPTKRRHRYQANRAEKSMHPGGILTVFCDGSVHWIDDSIEVGKGSQMGYWEMLFLSSDGGNLPQDIYNN